MREAHTNGFGIWYAVAFAWQLGFFIASPIIGFILLGLWLDGKFGTAPFFLLVGIVVGLLISVHEVAYLLSTFIKKRE